ncbi:hypothetical protein PtB15_4B28 [Puccinia triticina]|nr:hypothetical protein PtB15_4B28 [Puccinia triticina]
MPREVKDIKSFLLIAHRKDAKACRIKKSTRTTPKGVPTKVTKFKVRCSKYLYTLVLTDPEKAEKLRASLPPIAKTNHSDVSPTSPTGLVPKRPANDSPFATDVNLANSAEDSAKSTEMKPAKSENGSFLATKEKQAVPKIQKLKIKLKSPKPPAELEKLALPMPERQDTPGATPLPASVPTRRPGRHSQRVAKAGNNLA